MIGSQLQLPQKSKTVVKIQIWNKYFFIKNKNKKYYF